MPGPIKCCFQHILFHCDLDDAFVNVQKCINATSSVKIHLVLFKILWQQCLGCTHEHLWDASERHQLRTQKPSIKLTHSVPGTRYLVLNIAKISRPDIVHSWTSILVYIRPICNSAYSCSYVKASTLLSHGILLTGRISNYCHTAIEQAWNFLPISAAFFHISFPREMGDLTSSLCHCSLLLHSSLTSVSNTWGSHYTTG